MTKRRLLIWIPLVAILLNVGVYLIVSQLRTPSPPRLRSTSIDVTAGRRPSTVGEGHVSDPVPGQRPGVDREKQETALARRAAGLAALEAGDYAKAVTDLTEAQALLGDRANVADLLQVAQDLRRRSPAPPLSREMKPRAAPGVSR